MIITWKFSFKIILGQQQHDSYVENSVQNYLESWDSNSNMIVISWEIHFQNHLGTATAAYSNYVENSVSKSSWDSNSSMIVRRIVIERPIHGDQKVASSISVRGLKTLF